MQANNYPTTRQVALDLFRAADLDRDGKVTGEEKFTNPVVSAIAMNGVPDEGPVTQQMVNKYVEQFDAPKRQGGVKDGKLDTTEMMNLYQQAVADANTPRVVSEAETSEGFAGAQGGDGGGGVPPGWGEGARTEQVTVDLWKQMSPESGTMRGRALREHPLASAVERMAPKPDGVLTIDEFHAWVATFSKDGDVSLSENECADLQKAINALSQPESKQLLA